MSRNVLFIIPPKMFSYIRFVKSVVSSSSVTSSVPYGVLSISTYIRQYSKNKINVSILDFSVLPCSHDDIVQSIKRAINEFNPEIVGVSALFSLAYDSIKYFCDMVKLLKPSVITVSGGACAINDYEKILDETASLDAICYSEGELPFLRLVDSTNLIEVLENDVSWITRKSIREGRKPEPTLIFNLDEIPFIDYSLIDIKQYKPALDFNAFAEMENQDGFPNIYLSIHTTRGCPFNCIFCAASSVHGKKMRYMSAEYTIKSIENMIKQFGLTHLTIEDDQFLVDRNRAKEILRGISRLDTRIAVNISAVTVSYIDEEIVALMKKIGINNLNLAAEHGSEYVLRKIINKPFTINQLKNAVNILKKYEISPTFLIVTGLPGEREEDRDETIRLIKEIGIDWTVFHTATPFKGSRLYSICIENGYTREEDIKNTDMKHAVINTPDMTSEYITEKTYLMNLELNFVCNYRMKIGDYKTALIWFKEVERKYPAHAFAHYYLSKAYGSLKNPEFEKHHKEIFHNIVKENPDWQRYAKYFKLI